MSLKSFAFILGGVMLTSLLCGLLVLGLAYQRLKKIRVPKDADFFTTIRAVPLALVVGLDLLDLGLDSLSAPLEWLILNRLGLTALRNVATFEALIPFTGPIPTLTLAWIGARLFNLGEAIDPHLIQTRRVAPGRYEGQLS
ncbi:MAG: hypothetical protein ABJC13_25325 [Acidobacteriota bacterium]